MVKHVHHDDDVFEKLVLSKTQQFNIIENLEAD